MKAPGQDKKGVSPGLLSEQHKEILRLMLSTDNTLSDIAVTVGLPYQHVCDLYIGRPARDPLVIAFQAELKKNDTVLKEKLRRLMTENKLIVMEEINELLRDMRSQKKRDDRILVPILNALAKSSAGIEITANSITNQFVSMTSQELVHEFRRLTAITTSPKT